MPKLNKKLVTEYKKTQSAIRRSRNKLEKSVDKIVDNDIIQKLLKEKGKGCHWKVTGVEFCDDEYMKDTITEYEWVKVSEKEYYKLFKEENVRLYGYENAWNTNKESKLKEEYIYEPEFEIKYFHLREKKHEYLRVYVHESWGYGGNDDVSYDFLLTDLLDEKDLRKEKLEKLKNV